MPRRRLRRASAIDAHELLAEPTFWTTLWRWLAGAPASAEPPLDRRGRWPVATRVVDRPRG